MKYLLYIQIVSLTFLFFCEESAIAEENASPSLQVQEVQTKTFREGDILKTCKIKRVAIEQEKKVLHPKDAAQAIPTPIDTDPLKRWREIQGSIEYYDCVEEPYNVIDIIENDLCASPTNNSCDFYNAYKALFRDKPWFEQSLDTLRRGGTIFFNPKELPTCDENGEPKGLCCSIGSTYNHSYKACIPNQNIVSTEPQSEDDEDPLVKFRGCSMPLCNSGNGPDGTSVNTYGHWWRHLGDGKGITAYHYKDVGLTKK
ncbi:MAG: hypothetical protein AB8B83_03290 [Bdellovibrionales bacterium]